MPSKRSCVRKGTFVRSTTPKGQFGEVVDRVRMGEADHDLFSRCFSWKIPLRVAEPEVVAEYVLSHARRANGASRSCIHLRDGLPGRYAP
jgi:uncharacterized protein with PIN domain